MFQKSIFIISSLLVVVLLNSVASQALLDPCESKPCKPGYVCISKESSDFICLADVLGTKSTIGSRKLSPMKNGFVGGHSKQGKFDAPVAKPDTSAHDEFIMSMMRDPETVMAPADRPSAQRTNTPNGKERIMNVKNIVRMVAQKMDPVPPTSKNDDTTSSDEDILNMIQSPPIRNPFNAGFTDQMQVQNHPTQQSNKVQNFGKKQPLANPFGAGRMIAPLNKDKADFEDNSVSTAEVSNPDDDDSTSHEFNARPSPPRNPFNAGHLAKSKNSDEMLRTGNKNNIDRKQPTANPFGAGRMIAPLNTDEAEFVDNSVTTQVPTKPTVQSQVSNANDDESILNTILGFNARPSPPRNPFNAGRFAISKNSDDKLKTGTKSTARINTETPKPVEQPSVVSNLPKQQNTGRLNTEQPMVQQSNIIWNLPKHSPPTTVETSNLKPNGQLFSVKTALPVVRAEIDDAYIASIAMGSHQLNNKNTNFISKDVPRTTTTTTTTTTRHVEPIVNSNLVGKDLFSTYQKPISQPKPTIVDSENDDHVVRMINEDQDKVDLMDHVESYGNVDENQESIEKQNEHVMEEGTDVVDSGHDTAPESQEPNSDDQQTDITTGQHKSGEPKKALRDKSSDHHIMSSAMKIPFNDDRKRIGLRGPNARISVYNPTQQDFVSSRVDLIEQNDETPQQPSLSNQNMPETQKPTAHKFPTLVPVRSKISGNARLNQEQQASPQPVVNDKDVSKIINSILPNRPGEKKLPSQIPASFKLNRYNLKNFIPSTTSTASIKTPVHDSNAMYEAVQQMDEHEQGLVDGVLNVPDETLESETMTKKPYCNGQEFGDQIAHPDDSTKFIVCQKNGEYVVMRCPGKLKYNKYKNRCDHSDRQPQKACSSNPCLNNGTCMDTVDYDFICECKKGYSGDICDKYRDPCELNPCGENNICNPLPPDLHMAGFYCVCDGGKTYGLRCDDNSNKYKNPCMDSHQTYYPTDLAKSLFIQCENDALSVKQCKSPLQWSQEKLSCIRPNRR